MSRFKSFGTPSFPGNLGGIQGVTLFENQEIRDGPPLLQVDPDPADLAPRADGFPDSDAQGLGAAVDVHEPVLGLDEGDPAVTPERPGGDHGARADGADRAFSAVRIPTPKSLPSRYTASPWAGQGPPAGGLGRRLQGRSRPPRRGDPAPPSPGGRCRSRRRSRNGCRFGRGSPGNHQEISGLDDRARRKLVRPEDVIQGGAVGPRDSVEGLALGHPVGEGYHQPCSGKYLARVRDPVGRQDRLVGDGIGTGHAVDRLSLPEHVHQGFRPRSECREREKENGGQGALESHPVIILGGAEGNPYRAKAREGRSQAEGVGSSVFSAAGRPVEEPEAGVVDQAGQDDDVDVVLGFLDFPAPALGVEPFPQTPAVPLRGREGRVPVGPGGQGRSDEIGRHVRGQQGQDGIPLGGGPTEPGRASGARFLRTRLKE
ncbi:MAG: hypothetical protein MZV63_57555 [Marinilabiliales bacterium]|nr:hypothetical protein [Marinilabiliales bacterium]